MKYILSKQVKITDINYLVTYQYKAIRNFESYREIKLQIIGQKYYDQNRICEIFNEYFANTVDNGIIPNLLLIKAVVPNKN